MRFFDIIDLDFSDIINLIFAIRFHPKLSFTTPMPEVEVYKFNKVGLRIDNLGLLSGRNIGLVSTPPLKFGYSTTNPENVFRKIKSKSGDLINCYDEVYPKSIYKGVYSITIFWDDMFDNRHSKTVDVSFE